MMPHHYLNQWWNIVDWTLGNKLQWNLNRNLYICVNENPSENVIWKMRGICHGLNVLSWYSWSRSWKHSLMTLTHWGQVTHICISELTMIGSDNGLSPGRRQAIIWNNAWLLLIEPLGTNVREISIGIQTFSFKKMQLKMSSAKWRPYCLGLDVFIPTNFP